MEEEKIGYQGEEEEEVHCATIAHDLDKKVRSLDVIVEGKDSEVDFSGLYLHEDIVKGLHSCGFQKPSPIQLRAIPLGKLGLDLILQAKSGTGKTCVFSVIALENVSITENNIQVLIMAPCREIAVQNANVVKNIGVHRTGLCVKSFIGGRPIEKESRRIRACQVAVGTPGRLAHLIREFEMDLSHVKVFVLDEADKLLDASFYEDLETIMSALPPGKQVIAASATYPDGLETFVMTFMHCPAKVQLEVSGPVLLAVDQFVMDVKNVCDYEIIQGHTLTQDEIFSFKVRSLRQILRRVTFTQVIIFSAYQLRAEKLYDVLRMEDIDAVLLSGALDQTARLESLALLQQGKCRIMVATDLASRGIDAESVDLVINFDCPTDLTTYLHRMGRAGRFGAKGTVITFLSYSGDWTSIQKFNSKVNLNVKIIKKFTDLDKVIDSRSYANEYTNLQIRYSKGDSQGDNTCEIWQNFISCEAGPVLDTLSYPGILIRREVKEIMKNVELAKEMLRAAKGAKILEMTGNVNLNGHNSTDSNESEKKKEEKEIIEGGVGGANNAIVVQDLSISAPVPPNAPEIISGDENAEKTLTDLKSIPEVKTSRSKRVLSRGLRGRERGGTVRNSFPQRMNAAFQGNPMMDDAESSSMEETSD